ncbi:phosphatidate cytidylyltransferase, mitochondrial isoform X6 [Durio zibethinus]|uniref:Phosphatidate cytidylyltransferase, mitochondrial n=1 Tax=Durio zibethinus TaxID=66656 RepID=A0A6P5Z8F9_DURZI|nr:phosphatidate cytidylyltransferase, mitochondrial isoform X6 [Durio zibethinus]
MDDEKRAHLLSFLKVIPPVDFCCVYGSVLHTTNHDKSTMVDYILGVSDPLQWHSENLKMNADHYASWMVLLGGAKLVTEVADKIGVGVHFNPFVTWNNKMFKYGVVRMHDLVQDILNWERLYLSGRLQKPEDLYAKICSLSYMGDLRMFFAEDRNKVKKIVQGQFDLFQSMYKPFLEEYEGKDLLRFSSSENQHANIYQDCGLPVARSHVSFLPPAIRSLMGIRLGRKKVTSESVQALHEVVIGSREEATKRMQKVLRRTVMVSSARQAVSGLLTVGGVKAARYLTNKMQKAWRSWT